MEAFAKRKGLEAFERVWRLIVFACVPGVGTWTVMETGTRAVSRAGRFWSASGELGLVFCARPRLLENKGKRPARVAGGELNGQESLHSCKCGALRDSALGLMRTQ